MTKEQPDNITKFWDWFENNLKIIEDVILGRESEKRNEIIDGLDDHILEFGKIKWMLEQPQENHFELVLSPNGDHDLWKTTRRIIQDAPALGHWTFYHAIPPSVKLEIDIYDHYMNIQTVDARDWSLRLIPEANGVQRLHLSSDFQVDHLDPETFQIAVNIILTNLLGEQKLIEKISCVEIGKPEEEHEKNALIPIVDLPKQF